MELVHDFVVPVSGRKGFGVLVDVREDRPVPPGAVRHVRRG